MSTETTTIAPQLTAKPDGEVLAVYGDPAIEPALIRRKCDGSTSIFAPVPGIPSALLRELIRNAGVHIYSDGPDQVWACEDWIGLSIGSCGPRRIQLKPNVRLVDAFTEAKFASGRDGIVTIDGRCGDVILLRNVP